MQGIIISIIIAVTFPVNRVVAASHRIGVTSHRIGVAPHRIAVASHRIVVVSSVLVRGVMPVSEQRKLACRCLRARLRELTGLGEIPRTTTGDLELKVRREVRRVLHDCTLDEIDRFARFEPPAWVNARW